MDILLSVFLMGLLGGVHCLGMCGGVVAMLTASLDSDVKSNPKKVALFHLNYNIGRILSYILMGVAFGLLGAILTQTLQMSLVDKSLRIFSGVLMVMVGLYIGGWSSGIQILEKIGAKFWVILQPLTKRFLPVKNLKGAFFTGLLWGGIPCGLVYGALSFAIMSGSAADGALIMLAFGLGTLPSLLLMASLSTQLTRFVQKAFVRKLSGLLIIGLGVAALWMPINSMINGKPHGHNNTQQHKMNAPQPKTHKMQLDGPIKTPYGLNNFPKPTDLDYLT
ncbi:Heavy-metal-associated domain (N-terminus) and membrane-bounded cytochrome biogenesis cycZ-like domain, possible membrane copper tolerance protein [uncultured Gammaproteobacteria bacterium]|uniref:sulfite exporter TauE/SafE family protein n=1 Tax=Bathymodiolus heckerae thiotrophic gill symbiont TaxID=1052212 RepID=UPI0010B37273|nr:sulfite exporter TauE/SafE family protein [Bathymodiolus heckerae thiotrophic gill symbiont]CAC9956697.1 Heavy-metal-associated domain (N-terminus) and membrane-bounded cytochrome biogenesis cycZ-like domain, possible membrane copper tolerance protein [uncultured Gammaproteobacteria bacterium]SHN91846.1 Heavy-metal-associated domain (N-terminus) and membrane-bounded cytochrome biogenesis cycZ-like domain, possible membrane copper tolerance protein [Bathymodiolus heckerae thiotrophic gill symbi